MTELECKYAKENGLCNNVCDQCKLDGETPRKEVGFDNRGAVKLCRGKDGKYRYRKPYYGSNRNNNWAD